MSAVQTTKMSNFRWVICVLLFLATTVNYMDRQVLSLTWKDFIAVDFHWTDAHYGDGHQERLPHRHLRVVNRCCSTCRLWLGNDEY